MKKPSVRRNEVNFFRASADANNIQRILGYGISPPGPLRHSITHHFHAVGSAYLPQIRHLIHHALHERGEVGVVGFEVRHRGALAR